MVLYIMELDIISDSVLSHFVRQNSLITLFSIKIKQKDKIERKKYGIE